MTVAAGIEIMPGGGGPKGPSQVPSGTQKSARAESLAGGNALPGNPTSANAVWQSVLISLGVGVSEQNAQEPAIEETLDSSLGSMQGSAKGNDGATPFISGSVISRRDVQITLPPVKVRSGQESPGQIAMQQRAGTGPGIIVGRASLEKSTAMAASSAGGSSKDPAVSDSAGSPRKRTNSAALEEAVAPLQQMAPFQAALLPGHPIQQSFAAAVPHMEDLLQEKSPWTAALPDSASQLAGALGKVDLAAHPAPGEAARTPSDPGAREDSFHTPKVLAGGEISQSQNRDLSASGPSLLKEQIASGGEREDHQIGTAEAGHPASPQNDAVPVTGAAPVSVTGSSTSSKSLETPIATNTFFQDLPHPGTAQGEHGSWSTTQTGNRSPKPKSAAISKSGELNVAARNPAQPATGIQSGNPTPTPESSIHENRASAVIADVVAPAHNHHAAGATEGSGREIQAHAGSGGTVGEPVPAIAVSGIAIVPPPAPSIAAASAAHVVHGGSGAGEAFTALDAEGANRVTWVHAGGQQAEAGFEDPRLGWVSVRADVNGGAIHAALVPASADAAQVMGGHLDGLNAFLSEHHSAVETITLSAPSGRAHEELGSQGEGMQQRAGQESGQGSSQENGQERGNGFSEDRHANADSGERASAAASHLTQSARQETSVQQTNSGGRISLMA